MLLSLVYFVVRRLLRTLAPLARSDMELEAELLVLRHQVKVLSRNAHRPPLLSQRVVRAQELLETTALTVDSVAHRAGFRDAPTLRRHFVRRVGTTPSAYRDAFFPSPSTLGRPSVA
jgi:AraC-like DNA-binding protein